MTITRNFKLCLNAGTQNAPYINVNQYDEGEQWIFDLYTEGGQKFTPSTGAIIGIKSDGNAILNSGTVNASGQVVITETQQMTAASGLAVFELLIEGETHGTANFIVNVERRPSDDAEFSDSDLSMLQEAIDSVTEIEDLLGGQDVPTVITPIITGWLDDNITNPSNPPIDTSLTVAGAAADAKATGDEITDLKNAFDSTIIVTPSNNLLNPDNIIEGKLYSTTEVDGRRMFTLSENSAFSCAYIDIVPGDEYSLTGISYAVYTGDSEGYAIGVANATTSGSVENPALDTANVKTNYHNTDKTITRLYFSWKNEVFPTASYMANKGALLPYEPYGDPTRELAADIKVPSDSVTDETYFVDINGSGDFTSLMAAFVALKDNEKTKTIYVLSGEYDVYQEIGGDTFVNSIPSNAESYWDYVTLVPKNTKVIGVGGVVLKYLPESVPDIAAQFISPINISDGNVYMENIKIVCKNCRYGIHDQTRNNQPKGYEHIYKNVSVLKDSADGYTGKAQAFGGGMHKSAEFLFESCAFQSNRTSWSLHNAHDGSGNVVMRNCAFNNLIPTRNTYPSIRFGNVSGIQTHVNVSISGCYLNDEVRVGNESSVERPNAFDITMINCVGNTNINITTQTNIYTPQIFNA